MQHLHRTPKHDLAVEIILPISAEQVVKIKRKRRISRTVTIRIARWQRGVAPAGIRGNVIEENVQLRRLVVTCLDPVRGLRCDGNLAANSRTYPVIDHGVVE